MAFERSDDPVVALQAASGLLAGERFEELASVLPGGDTAAAQRVTDVADVFITWLRRLTEIRLTLVAIEEQDTGTVVATTGGTVTTISDGQQARYVIDAKDARGFDVDATLQVTATGTDGNPSANVTASILEAETGTASGKDELVVVGTAPGDSSLVKVFDPANPDTIFGSDSVDVTPGGVATVSLGTATIEDQPAAVPAP